MIKIPNFYASPLKEIKTSLEGKKMTRSKDPRDIKVKDSLHDVAKKNNKPFYSKKYKVNVGIEDGVLSNVPKTGNYEEL
jgi:hypothetical protein|tara:strand:+ start:154 stop:390 length:237 start_codon:yes stop_codon:yes gene_type:complete